MKHVLVPIANDSEELEAVGIIDTLRRAGIVVTVASIEKELQITGSRKTKLIADCLIGECLDKEYDCIALPGGMPGAEYLRDCDDLITLLKKQGSQNKLIAAICASPAVVFVPHNLIEGKTVTCHPALQDQIPSHQLSTRRVVVDGNCITSQGPGTVLEFSIKLIELLLDKKSADSIAGPMLIT